MFFVSVALLQEPALKFITLIPAVDVTITTGGELDAESIVASVLVKRTGAEAYPLHFSPTRVASQVISHLPVVVAKNKAGELGLARSHNVRTCPPERTLTPSLATSNFHGPF